MLFGGERVLKRYSLSNAFTLAISAPCVARCEGEVVFYITVAVEIPNIGSRIAGLREPTQPATRHGKDHQAPSGSFLLEQKTSSFTVRLLCPSASFPHFLQRALRVVIEPFLSLPAVAL